MLPTGIPPATRPAACSRSVDSLSATNLASRVTVELRSGLVPICVDPGPANLAVAHPKHLPPLHRHLHSASLSPHMRRARDQHRVIDGFEMLRLGLPPLP